MRSILCCKKQNMLLWILIFCILTKVKGQLEFIGPKNATNVSSLPIAIPLGISGFPLGKNRSNMAYLMRNGIILFNESEASVASDYEPQVFPSDEFSYVLAPFWVSDDSVENVELSYDMYSGASATLDSVNRFIVGTGRYFKGTWMLVTRWNKMAHTVCNTTTVTRSNVSSCSSYSNQSNSGSGSGNGTNHNETEPSNCTSHPSDIAITICYTLENTFQAILITNEQDSYAVYLYECGLLQWIRGNDTNNNAIVGYSTPEQGRFKNHPLSGSSNVGQIACNNSRQWNSVLYELATGTLLQGLDYLPFLPLRNTSGVSTTNLWPGDDENSGPIYINGGFPFGATIQRVAYVGINGIVSFGQPWYFYYPQPFPTWWYWGRRNYIVAPYWNDHDTRRSGSISFEVHQLGANSASSELLNNVSRFIEIKKGGSFSGRWMAVVQWDSVHPYPHGSYWWWSWYYYYFYYYYYYYYQLSSVLQKTNTYQAIVITDGIQSYTVFTYYCGRLEWSTNTFEPFSTVGYNSGGQFYENHPFTGHPFVNDIACVNAEHQVAWSNVVYKLSLDSDVLQQIRARCIRQYQTDVTLFPSEPNVNNVLPCPCSIWQAFWNWQFWFFEYTGDSYCAVQWSSQGKSWRCCYSLQFTTWGALLLTKDDKGSSLLLYNPFWDYLSYKTYDEGFRDLCCGIGWCDLYYERRPVATCSGYVQPFWARMWGDPHITTLDGRGYTFNGWGEYTLLRLNDSSFFFQGRMAPIGNASGTQFSAFAMGHPNSTVEMMTDGGQLIFFYNGTNITDNLIQNANFSYNDALVLKNNSNSYIVSFSNGIGAVFSLSAGLPNFVLSIPSSLRAHTSGLLGNFNGNQTDDLMFPNNTVLTGSVTDRMIHAFGQSWQVSCMERLFSNATGQPVSHPEYVPLFADELNTTGKNTSACRGDASCIYDYIATGRLEVGVASMGVNTTIMQALDLASNFPPVVNGSDIFVVTIGATSVYSFSVTDDSGLGTHASVVGGIPRAGNLTNISNAFTFSWNPATTEDVYGLTFYATDLLGATGILRPKVYVCSCLNGGNCTWEGTFSSIRNVTTMQCNCPPAWEGGFCDTDADGCVSLYCGDESTCYDLPAPLVGAECSCPPGYVHNGTDPKFQDINECQNLSLCSQLCVNTDGSYQCDCFNGYSDVQGVCKDINECLNGMASCHQVCVNDVESYHCACFTGFELNADNTTCSVSPRSECPSNNNCSPNLCALINGSTHCQCTYGYTLDNTTRQCVDYNECSKPETCDHNCTNLNGSYSCSCLDGYTLQEDGRTCADIDECVLNARLTVLEYNSTLCITPHVCINIIGSYECACPPGTVKPNCSVLQGSPPPLSSPRPPSASELANSFNMTICGLSVNTFSDTLKVKLRTLTANVIQQYCSNRTCNTSTGNSIGQVDVTSVHLFGIASTTSYRGKDCIVMQVYATGTQAGVLAVSTLSSAVQASSSLYIDSGFSVLKLSSLSLSVSLSTVPTATMATTTPPKPAQKFSIVGAAVGITLGVCVPLLILFGIILASYLLKAKGTAKVMVMPMKDGDVSLLPHSKWQYDETSKL